MLQEQCKEEDTNSIFFTQIWLYLCSPLHPPTHTNYFSFFFFWSLENNMYIPKTDTNLSNINLVYPSNSGNQHQYSTTRPHLIIALLTMSLSYFVVQDPIQYHSLHLILMYLEFLHPFQSFLNLTVVDDKRFIPQDVPQLWSIQCPLMTRPKAHILVRNIIDLMFHSSQFIPWGGNRHHSV